MPELEWLENRVARTYANKSRRPIMRLIDTCILLLVPIGLSMWFW